MKLTTVLSIGAIASTAIAKNIAGVQSFNFDVSRGNDFASSHKSKRAKIVKRDTPDGAVETVLENQNSFYSVSLLIGDNSENVTVLIDTGSSDLWVTGSSNPFCSSSGSSSDSNQKFRKLDFTSSGVSLGHRRVVQKDDDSGEGGTGGSPFGQTTASQTTIETQTDVSSSQATIDCSQYGTFDTSSSSTFHSNNTEFYIVYGDSSFAYGTWGYDDVTVGGTKVKNLSFAVANETNSTVGVLGIGLEGLETTYSSSYSSSNSYTYSNFPAKLVEDGLINKRVYSLYLNSEDSSQGNILFGGVDHAKYSGTLLTIPLINTLSSRGYTNIIKLEVTLSGVGVESGSDQTTVTTTKYPALLDSGTTLTYMPSDLITSIANALNAEYSSSIGYYITECYGSDDGYLVYDLQGKLIKVPLSDIILQTSSSSKCVLGLLDSGDDSIILGDSFLRSAYVVYDLDNLEISLAQADYTDDSDIDVISDSVPSASRAADYSSTWSTQQSATSSGNIFTNSDSANAVSTSGGSSRSSSTKTSGSGSSSTSSSSSSSDSKSTGASLQASLWSIVSLTFIVATGLVCM